MGAPKGAGWQERFAGYIVRQEPDDKGEQRAFCPLCEDPGTSKSPSASFNFERGSFKCFSSCKFGGSLSSLWQRLQEVGAAEQAERMAEKASVRSIKEAKSVRGEAAPLPTEDQISEWHRALMSSEEPLRVMREDRGLSDETLEKFQIGYNGKDRRFTIPVRDADGTLVNVRRYRPGEEGAGKVIGIDGRNQATLYGLAEIKNAEEVWLTEGEMDRLVNQQHGFPTATATGGAGTWRKEFDLYFTDKVVYICYDVDDNGASGAQKVAASLTRTAREVYIVKLPLLAKKSDITDYYVKHGYAASDMRELCDSTKAFWVRAPKAGRLPSTEVTLEGSMSAEHGRNPLTFRGMIAGKVQPSYLLPHKVEFSCSQDFNVNKCAICPMGPARGGSWETEIEPEDPNLLRMVDAPEKERQKVLNSVAGAPANCNRLRADAISEWNVEELVIVPPIEARDATGNLVRKVFNVGSYDTPVNIPAQVVGINLPDPKTARSAFLSWECEPTEADIDKFEMTPEIMKKLEVFMPAEGQSPIQKCQEIARDLSANVTRIYGRTLMHIAYDLVWHSVLGFNLNGVSIDKGWLELLVVGDTRTGKSEVALRLTDHYRSGILRSCEGATLAGLVGGAQQLGSQWMVTWGAIPLNDRRLVVLDEASGLKDKDIIEQMSAIRSSGKAQITKIVSQETNARTRLIWISNPADGRPMSEHARGGVEAIRSLVKNPEDIARFDIAMSAASEDVPSTIINRKEHDKVDHVYTSELCALLIHWAWSRKPEDIVWDTGAEQAILDAAEEVGARYVADPPLVQAENVRVKLARLAVAIAARTFSTDENGQQVVVYAEHVESAVKFLDTVYGMDSFGYRRHSTTVLRHRAQASENTEWTRRYLHNNSEDVLVALQSCLGGPFKVRDFCEFAGMDQYSAQTATRDLISHRMLRRLAKGNIVMEPTLIQILKEFEGYETL